MLLLQASGVLFLLAPFVHPSIYTFFHTHPPHPKIRKFQVDNTKILYSTNCKKNAPNTRSYFYYKKKEKEKADSPLLTKSLLIWELQY